MKQSLCRPIIVQHALQSSFKACNKDLDCLLIIDIIKLIYKLANKNSIYFSCATCFEKCIHNVLAQLS
jgi:hypothetical protein